MVKQFSLRYLSSLLSPTLALASLQILRTGSLILIPIIIAKLLSKPQYLFEYESIVLQISTFSFFLQIGGTQILFQEFHQKLTPAEQQLTLNRFFSQHLIFAVAICVLFGLFQSLHFKPFTFLIAAIIFLSNLNYAMEFIWLIQGKKHRAIFCSGLYYSLWVIGTVFCIEQQNTPAMLLVWLGLHLIRTLVMIFSLKMRWSSFTLSSMQNTLIMSIKALFSAGAEYLNFWFVKAFFSPEQFVLYRLGARELPFTNMFASSLSNSLLNFMQNQNYAPIAIKKRITKILHINFVFTAAFLMAAPYLYEFLYNQQFIVSSRIFQIYLLINICRTLLFDFFLLYKQQHRFLLFTSITENALISFNAFCILFWDMPMFFFAFSIVLTFFIEKMILYLRLRRLNVQVSEFYPFKLWGLYTFFLLVVFIMVFRF